MTGWQKTASVDRHAKRVQTISVYDIYYYFNPPREKPIQFL